MREREPRAQELVSALRDDVPSEAEQLRLKQRLLALGVVSAASSSAGGALTSTASAAACGKTTTGLSLTAKLLGTFSTTKTLVVVAAIGTSVALRSEIEMSPAPVRTTPGTSVMVRHTLRAKVPAHPLTEEAAGPSTPHVTSESPNGSVQTGLSVRMIGPRVRPVQAREPEKKHARPTAPMPSSMATIAEIERPSDLAMESDLLLRATLAIRARDLGAASAWLERHAREFPVGLLAEERELARQKLKLPASASDP